MNEGQEKFYTFILSRIQKGKEEEARALLSESFAKQADGTFTMEYKSTFIPRMISLLQPETIEEVKNIMAGYQGPN